MGCPNLRTLVLIRTGQASLGVRTAGLAVDRSALRRRDGRHGGRDGGVPVLAVVSILQFELNF